MIIKANTLSKTFLFFILITSINSHAEISEKEAWNLFKEANHLYHGLGVPENKSKARVIYKNICEYGFWKACSNYGFALYDMEMYGEAEKVFLNNINKHHDFVSLENLIHLYRNTKFLNSSEEKAQKYEKLLLKWKSNNPLNKDAP